MLYHLLTQAMEWDASGEFRPPTLQAEGFVHLSFAHQVAWVANQFLNSVPQLWVAEIDPARLTAEVRVEDPGIGQGFPHLYGPIQQQAVRRIFSLSRSGSGDWVFDPSA